MAESQSGVVRIGVLGAARITPLALCKPAKTNPRVKVAAVAARDRARAQEFATKWSIPIVRDSYQALVEDDGIDAVYNPLPNGLHGAWTTAALDAGKHVLCEKPFAANAAEARAVADHAAGTGKVVMEAFHWRYHPLTKRILGLLADGAIGEVRSARTSLCFPIPKRTDIRWQLDLAGGALMDAGCYTIHILRTFLGSEPTVRHAKAWERLPGVDRLVEAELDFDGISASMRCSMWSRHVLATWLHITGTDGEIKVLNPQSPQIFSVLSWTSRGKRTRERPARTATYAHQLDAFAAAVLDGAPYPTDTADAVANMAVIDSVYHAAGMAPREPTPVR